MSIDSTRQSPPPSQPPPHYNYPPVTIILTIILLVFFFVGFFAIYFCRCFVQNLLFTWHLRQNPARGPAVGPTSSNVGLDPMIVQSFPTFLYSSVKGYQKEKYGLECAICLIEFDSSDVVRLLTACYHVFHKECVDAWLESHKTCPVCRRALDAQSSPVKTPTCETVENPRAATPTPVNSDRTVSITVKDDSEVKTGASDRQRNNQGVQSEVETYYRSHSTGHSIDVRTEDRFTLRLPEHVKSNIIRGHKSSRSWTNFEEFKSMDVGEPSGEHKV